MSENLQKLLQEALNNNSYDYDAMHNTLKQTWMNSYSYLYEKQRASVEYEELFYYSNDTISRNSKLIGNMYLDKLIYANFDVDYDLIHVYDREEFRRSKFYLSRFKLEDMIANPDIFYKIPIVIIDDKVIWDYTIRVTKDCTSFTLPFRRNFVLKDERNEETDDVIYVDHKVQVLVVDNCYYERIKLNNSNIYFNPIADIFKIRKSILSYNKTHDGVMMCSIHYPNEGGKGYELGSPLIPLEDDGEFYTARIPHSFSNEMFTYSRDYYVSIWFVEGLYKKTFYTGNDYTIAREEGADLFVMEESPSVPFKSPIPVQDFMVFKTDVEKDTKLLVKNTETLEVHYPNIYRIIDPEMKPGDKYEVYYFYHREEDLQYTVLFDFYFMFLLNKFEGLSLEKIINDIYYDTADYGEYTEEQIAEFKDTFQKIYDYQYFHHQYGESDFLHRYVNIEGNEDKEPIEYKDETLKQWIKVQPWVLRDYVLEQKKLGASYHLFTNTLDLPSRLRRNTEMEMKDHSRDFEEERYVFAFNNEKDFPILLEARVFVDGIFVNDLYQERHLYMDYFYIPKDMVTDDSYIEIEIFPSYAFSQNVFFENMDDAKEISLLDHDDDIFPTISDIYPEDFEELPFTHRYDITFFDITEHYDRGDFLVEPVDKRRKPIKFTRLNTFTIKPNSEEVIGVPLSLNINKCPNGMEVYIDQDGYPYMEIIERKFRFHIEYIRVYKNGRLLPRCRYDFFSTFATPRLMIYDWCSVGDLIYIDVTPYRYKEIYYQEELQPTDTLIDLRDKITKPFDIRYYDVYLNGRKLSLNNVFSITPWEITLVNLKSIYNLTIYEKERDWEYFGLDYKENIYYYSIDDLFNTGFISDEEKNKLIKQIIDKNKDRRLNIYPNENIEVRQDYTDNRKYAEVWVFYFCELIPKTYVNPDRLQFKKDIMEFDYHFVYETYKKEAIDAARDDMERKRKEFYPEAICLDPDHYEKGENELGTRLVYMVGHPDDVDEEILNESITIKNDGNIETY